MFGLIKKYIYLANGSNHTNCVPLSNQKRNIQPILINLHPDTVKNFTIIHLQLNWIDMLEVVII